MTADDRGRPGGRRPQSVSDATMVTPSPYIAPQARPRVCPDCAVVSALLLASDWERAAIVAAFVELGEQHQNRHQERSSALLTPKEFAALGIAGLRSDNSVRRYVEAGSL